MIVPEMLTTKCCSTVDAHRRSTPLESFKNSYGRSFSDKHRYSECVSERLAHSVLAVS